MRRDPPDGESTADAAIRSGRTRSTGRGRSVRAKDETERFAELVCALSSRLAGASAERILAEVEAALEAIRVHFGVDQCTVLKLVPERRAVVLIRRAAVPGVPPIPETIDYGKAFPTTYRTVVEELRPYVLDRLDDIPPDETAQRESSIALELGAYVAIPIVSGGVARYSLAMGCNGRPHRWRRDRIRLMQALGEIIASALDRREGEERLRRSVADLAQAQRVARTGSWVRDFVADLFSASDEAYRIIGARPVSSDEWRACIHPDDRERVGIEVRTHFANHRQTYRSEYRVVQPGGDVRVIVDEGEVLYHETGQPLRAIGTIRDVTETRRTAREIGDLRSRIWHADRAARAGALGGSLAHELGQPLAAILANAQAGLRFLDSGALDADGTRSILEAIVRDDKRATAIIDGLRSLLRKEAAPKEPVDLAEALTEVVSLVRREAEGLGVRIETRLAPGLLALAAKAQLQQVGLNFLSNALEAVRAKPAGERRVVVDGARVAGSIEISVSDSGEGVAQPARDSIFEPFRSTRSGGLGLGLAISRSIVESHEGRIGVATSALGGARFHFSLPALDEDRAPAANDARSPSPTLSSPRPALPAPAAGIPCVCVVDDDRSVREGLVRLLSSAGYAVVPFASGDELLASHEVARADCAILDVRMSGLSGPELHGRLAGRYPWLPVIFLTAHRDVPTGVHAMRTGAADFLLKPVADTDLLAAVGRAVRLGAETRRRDESRRVAVERLERLSPREREILEQVALGHLNKRIAADLRISEATVKQHRGRVMDKLGVRSVPALIQIREAAMATPSYQGRIPDEGAGP
ncbi:MAG: response regulator [Burkholderiales bacterium]|nr:response regulator [Burkholderiales bacterium]